MEKVRALIEQHAKWTALEIYIERIEAYFTTDFSLSLENAKSLLEAIGREICDDRGIELPNAPSTKVILKKAFIAIGYSGDDLVNQISTSLANIGQQLGNLRNEIGLTAHGKSLEEIKERNNKVDEFTKEFLIDTTEIVASFLIRGFESMTTEVAHDVIDSDESGYQKNTDFNEFWDESFGDFEMGAYSYPASEILYNVDIQAYVTAHKAFKAEEA
jgi:hypothetical protein